MSLTNKALFVIERNLNRELSLGEIAERCKVSRFHLAHAFGEATGRPVMEYVRQRRLTEAACALAAGAGDILDVALDSGYASHEAFTRAFKAEFGKTPEEVRDQESVAGLTLVEAVPLNDRKAVKLAPPRVEKVGQMLFVGLSERAAYGETQHIPGQWQRFMSGPYQQIEHIKEEIPVGIGTQNDEGAIVYVCAAEVSRFNGVPKGLIKLTVAPTTYAVFAHDAHITLLQQTYVAIWNDWFPASGKAPAEAPSLERHNPTFDTRTGEGGVKIWIPIAP
jgi:AraC family transcriptional regulator